MRSASLFGAGAIAAYCVFSVTASPISLDINTILNQAPSDILETGSLPTTGSSSSSSSSSSSAASSDSRLESRDDLDCTPGAAPFPQAACWDQLKVSDWLNGWLKDNAHTCSSATADFGTCFHWRWNRSGVTCDQLGVSSCTPPDADKYKDSPEAYLVLWNIYAINNYMSMVWTALSNAHSLVNGQALSIIQQLNPVVKQNVALNAVLTAVSSILLFIPIPGAGIAAHEATGAAAAGARAAQAASAGSNRGSSNEVSGGGSTVNVAASSGSSAGSAPAAPASGSQTLLSNNAAEGAGGPAFQQLYGAISATPIVSKFLFPVGGTLDSQINQFSDITSKISSFTDKYQNKTSDAIREIIGNSTTFLKFAQTKFFIAKPVDLQELSYSYTQALNTALISDVMVANNIVVTVGNINAAVNAGYTYAPSPDGLSDENWLDTATNDSYSMTNLRDIAKDYGPVFNNILKNNLTTTDLLFKGTNGCPRGATPKFSAPDPNNPSAPVTLSCLNNAGICHYEQNTISPTKEFTDCTTQAKFAKSDCDGNSDGSSTAIRMPKGYVGAYFKSNLDYC